ncbi:hypothetical protein [Novosphingobium olei]|uniref:glycosyltransferase family 2 protein n=1 Tax=Novosphingobium olei TaxID=2728851 RepID=UPI0030906FFD|nr:hypothetical protein NSDW_29660 [Novosphingobium olei]
MSFDWAVDDGAAGDRKTCILLAGLQGTDVSALSFVLRKNWGALGPESADFSAAVASLNADVLAAFGADSLSFEPLAESWLGSALHASLRGRAVDLLSRNWSSRAHGLIDDPSTGVLLPFWRDALEAAHIRPVVIAIYNFQARDQGLVPEYFNEPGASSDAVWLSRFLEMEKAGRGLHRSHVITASLQSDAEAVARRVAIDLGQPSLEQKAVRNIEVCQAPHLDLPSGELGRWIGEVVATVERWALGGEDQAGRDRIDVVAGAFGQVRPLLTTTITVLGHEMRRLRNRCTELSRQIAELQLCADPISRQSESMPARSDELNNQVALMEARWAEIFRDAGNETEILTEQNAIFSQSIAQLSDDVASLTEKLAVAEADVSRLKLIEIAQQAEAKAANVEASSLRKSLAASQASVKKLQQEASVREAQLNGLQDELLDRAAANARLAMAPQRQGRATFALPDFTLPLSPKARRKERRNRVIRALIISSGLFDEKFYAARYPDVIAAGADPLDHFIKFGGAEGRHPSAAFNSKWYLSENPDVQSAGLNPLVHYLEFGRDEGRRRRSLNSAGGADAAKGVSGSKAKSPEPALAQVAPADIAPQKSELISKRPPRRQTWKGLLAPVTVRREPYVPLDQLAAQQDGRPLTVGGVVIARLPNGAPVGNAVHRVALFASLRTGEADAVRLAGNPVSCPSPFALLSSPGLGIEHLTDAWHDGPNTLTLRFANGQSGVVRVFQFGSDNSVIAVGEARLCGTEADLAAVDLLDPIGELLVAFCSPDGALIDAMVIPFPSLLRGGLHYGELAVIEAAPGTMVTLADYSRTLAMELLGWSGGPDTFTVGRIEIDMRGATGTEPIFRPSVISGLAARFGLALGTVASSAPPQRDQLVASLASAQPIKIAERTGAPAVLQLPCDTVPSLFAIVSRRLSNCPCTARVAIVDAATLKPLADLSIPYGTGFPVAQHAALPAHVPVIVNRQFESASVPGAPTFPLAVRYYNRLVWQGDPLMPVSPDQDLGVSSNLPASGIFFSAIIDAGGDEKALASCLASLSNQVSAGKIEVILAGWDEERPLPQSDWDLVAVPGAHLPRATRLNAAAERANGDALLFVDPSVVLSDPRTMALLAGMVQAEGTATAACALVTEHDDGEDAVVHSAGYFPTRVSLSGEPVFDFSHVDVSKIIPAATYPVVANQALCCLISAKAWKALNGFDAFRFPAAMFDLDFGIRALQEGFSNLCTTLVRAATRHAVRSEDFPDAIAHSMARPYSWATVFERATVIREMRR